MSALIDLVNEASEVLAQAGEKERVFTDAAMAYLGVTTRTTPEVTKLVGEMTKLDKEQPSAAQGFVAVQKAVISFTAAAAVTAAGVSKYAQSASPQLVSALGTSFELLSAKIGGQLLPVVGEAIDTVQDVADWFDTLGDGQKKLVAGLVVATPAIAALGYGVKVLVPAANAATAAITRMNAASRSMGAGSAMGTIAGAAGIIGVAASAVLALQAASSATISARRDVATHTGRVTEEELEAAGLNRQQRERIMGGGAGAREERNAMHVEAAHRREYNHTSGAKAGDLLGFQVTEFNEQKARTLESLEARLQESGGQVTSKDELDWRKKVKQQSMQANAANRENQPHYSGFTEARKQLQIQLLKQNPYEQKLLAEQRKNRDELNKRLDRLVKIGEKLGYRMSD